MSHSTELISILIPVYNEEKILERSARKVHAYMEERGLGHEIVVVDNGSTDRTRELGRAFSKENSWFRFVELPKRGVGAAFAEAVRQARGDWLVSLDVDLSFDLRFIDYATDLLKYADMVLGSKSLGRQRRSIIRVIGSQLYILFAQYFFNLTVSDYSIGCKAYRREAVLPIVTNLDTWTGYVFELCLYMAGQGKRVIQVGVDCDDRRPSHFNLLHEGFYRYAHLFRCWRILKNGGGWFRDRI